jgi:lincosamide nucleotidyltransferase A/C/D/E
MRGVVPTTEWGYRERRPWAPMGAEEIERIADAVAAASVEMWIDGGWGVDALLGEQTREHDDLDVVIALADVQAFETALAGVGYERSAGAAPTSFVLVNAEGRQVDAHPVVFDDLRGGGVYLMEDGREWVYPAEGFAGRGRVGSRDVRCLTPEVQVLVHDGYELEEKDYRELFLLHDRFGVELPAKYAERARAGWTKRRPARDDAPPSQ